MGSFEQPQEAAVARARAMACGPETLPSPRKQAARNSGVAECRPGARLICFLMLHCLRLCASLRVVCSQTIGRRCARVRRTRHAHQPRQRERPLSIGWGWMRAAQRRGCARLCIRRIHSTVFSVQCSDRSAASAWPASAPGYGSLWHGHACPAATVMRAH